MSDLKFTRRETIAALGATVALPLLAKASPVFAQAKVPASDAQASALLDFVRDRLPRSYLRTTPPVFHDPRDIGICVRPTPVPMPAYMGVLFLGGLVACPAGGLLLLIGLAHWWRSRQ